MPALPQLHPLRFGDLKTAIEPMARKSPARQLPADWQRFLPPKPLSAGADTWEELFKQHPDLFRMADDDKVALLYRHNLPLQHVTTNVVVTHDQFMALSSHQREKYDRPPLTDEQVKDVIAAAKVVQERMEAIAKHRRERLQGWVKVALPLLFGSGGLIGFLISQLTGK